jgi:ribosomal protein S6--L-glutamate ligase
MSAITLMLGKPRERSPVIAEVVDELRARGHDVRCHVPSRVLGLPAWLHDADLVALRGLDAGTLTALAAPELAAVRFLDDPRALLAVRDRAGTAGRLDEAGLSTPAHWPSASWGDVQERSARHGGSFAIKHVDSSIGRSAQVWLGDAQQVPVRAPFPGPYHLERHLGGGRTEVKLYRVGAHLAGFVIRGAAATPIEIDDRLREVGVRATDVLGLSLAGLDLLIDDASEFIIDANAFPSCRRLPDAVQRIATYLDERSGYPQGASQLAIDDHVPAS